MINFDKLPTKTPAGDFPLIPEGKYKATIEKAEMKQPKQEDKPPYLSLTWNVFDEKGNSLGKLFDILSESSSEYVMFKLRKFIEAIDINIGSTFELRDLTKVSVGKTCIITVAIDKKSDPNRNQINIFCDHPYAKITDKTASTACNGDSCNVPWEEEDTPFNAPESEPTPTSKESY